MEEDRMFIIIVLSNDVSTDATEKPLFEEDRGTGDGMRCAG